MIYTGSPGNSPPLLAATQRGKKTTPKNIEGEELGSSGSKEPSVPTLLVPSACVSLFRRHAFPYFNSSFNRDTRSGQRHRVALTENQIERRLDPLFDRTHPFSQASDLLPLVSKYETPLSRVGTLKWRILLFVY